jgi:hypothetical protein
LEILNESSPKNEQLLIEIERIVIFVIWINFSFVKTNLRNENEIKEFLKLFA